MARMQGPAELFWEDRTLYHIGSKRVVEENLTLDEAGERYQGLLITVTLRKRKRVGLKDQVDRQCLAG